MPTTSADTLFRMALEAAGQDAHAATVYHAESATVSDAGLIDEESIGRFVSIISSKHGFAELSMDDIIFDPSFAAIAAKIDAMELSTAKPETPTAQPIQNLSIPRVSHVRAGLALLLLSLVSASATSSIARRSRRFTSASRAQRYGYNPPHVCAYASASA